MDVNTLAAAQQQQQQQEQQGQGKDAAPPAPAAAGQALQQAAHQPSLEKPAEELVQAAPAQQQAAAAAQGGPAQGGPVQGGPVQGGPGAAGGAAADAAGAAGADADADADDEADHEDDDEQHDDDVEETGLQGSPADAALASPTSQAGRRGRGDPVARAAAAHAVRLQAALPLPQTVELIHRIRQALAGQEGEGSCVQLLALLRPALHVADQMCWLAWCRRRLPACLPATASMPAYLQLAPLLSRQSWSQ
jgi:hypothetical protein